MTASVMARHIAGMCAHRFVGADRDLLVAYHEALVGV